jgi:hypothetical protein
MKIGIGLALILVFGQTLVGTVHGQGPGRGSGYQGGRGGGPPSGRGPGMHGSGRLGSAAPGAGGDERHEADREVFHFLLTNHEKIQRTVKELPNGVETLTESKDTEVAARIKEHVGWMAHRVEKTQPIRMRDPLFAELFRHTDKIKIAHVDTDKGVKVIETSDDPQVVRLIQAHAKVVSGFVEHGFAEAMKNHPVPSGSK